MLAAAIREGEIVLSVAFSSIVDILLVFPGLIGTYLMAPNTVQGLLHMGCLFAFKSENIGTEKKPQFLKWGVIPQPQFLELRQLTNI